MTALAPPWRQVPGLIRENLRQVPLAGVFGVVRHQGRRELVVLFDELDLRHALEPAYHGILRRRGNPDAHDADALSDVIDEDRAVLAKERVAAARSDAGPKADQQFTADPASGLLRLDDTACQQPRDAEGQRHEVRLAYAAGEA